MSDFDKAIAFFAKYGGVTTDTEKLRRSWAVCTVAQLQNAVSHALVIEHRPSIEVNQHLLALFGSGK